MIQANIGTFFATARERYQIYLRRAGLMENVCPLGTFTTDPIFGKYRFCNLFRELDKTTVWFRDNLRQPLRNDPAKVLFATVAFRWFNRIETGEKIKHLILEGDRSWHPDAARQILKDAKPVVTGAYIIKTPNGMNKLDGVLWCIEQIRKDIDHLAGALDHTPPEERTLEGVWETLRQYPYLGDFMSYECVTDLRHTCWLDKASDISTWANPGPGCTRGLGWVVSGDMEKYNRGSKKDRVAMAEQMNELLDLSLCPKYWPTEWPQWEMREVEHWLCEQAKYTRVRDGGSPPKQLFRLPK